MTQRIPLMFINSKILSRYFYGLGNKLSNIFSSVQYDLNQTDLDISSTEYFANMLLNTITIFIFFLILLFTLLFFSQRESLPYSLGISSLLSFAILIMFLFLYMRYPKISAGKKGEQLDKHLVFALKDILLQITSGVTLYNGLVNISKAGYGQVSIEFGKVSKSINAGKPVDKALEEMAVKSSSEFLRRAIWQLINTLKAGASLQGALRSIIGDLTLDQSTKIKDYGRELNLWSLIYMLFAVAVPTMGATLMVILSSFAGSGMSKTTFISFITVTFLIQIVIIGFIKSRRPIVTL
tara:strand:- start:841 stop:1725 length:885 start_codon:yes stop_codon:yes gene_type:complete